MFEGIYFQFPKLAFLFFFFLACEALCPLRTNALYFPGTERFGEVGVKPALWMWMLKWAMIGLFVVALMSPVRDKQITYQGEGGYDILLILDPAAIDGVLKERIRAFVDMRPDDAIAVWVPGKSEVAVPLTNDHVALKSILSQLHADEYKEGDADIGRFFRSAEERGRWTLLFSEDPGKFSRLFSKDRDISVAPKGYPLGWIEAVHRDHPVIGRMYEHRYVDYYYVYPLFIGFLAMLGYLYGRNQKGLK